MPIYEYRCSKCGEFEVTQKITDKALTKCPTCKGKVTKLISSTSFQLKGSGWYVTDYARSGSGTAKESTPSESTPETKSESASSSSESTSDSKTEKKPKATGSGKKGKQAAAA